MEELVATMPVPLPKRMSLAVRLTAPVPPYCTARGLTAVRVVKFPVEALTVVPENRVSLRILELRFTVLPEAVVLVPLPKVIRGEVVEVTTPLASVTRNLPRIPVKPRLVVVAEVNMEVDALTKPEVQMLLLPPWNILWTVVVE